MRTWIHLYGKKTIKKSYSYNKYTLPPVCVPDGKQTRIFKEPTGRNITYSVLSCRGTFSAVRQTISRRSSSFLDVLRHARCRVATGVQFKTVVFRYQPSGSVKGRGLQAAHGRRCYFITHTLTHTHSDSRNMRWKEISRNVTWMIPQEMLFFSFFKAMTDWKMGNLKCDLCKRSAFLSARGYFLNRKTFVCLI